MAVATAKVPMASGPSRQRWTTLICYCMAVILSICACGRWPCSLRILYYCMDNLLSSARSALSRLEASSFTQNQGAYIERKGRLCRDRDILAHTRCITQHW